MKRRNLTGIVPEEIATQVLYNFLSAGYAIVETETGRDVTEEFLKDAEFLFPFERDENGKPSYCRCFGPYCQDLGCQPQRG